MKTNTVHIVVITLLILLVGMGLSVYNKLVRYDESSKEAWSQVENQYQRRSDLIPNIVSTVKGYATHEQKTLDAVVSARSRASSITLDPEKLTPQQLEAYDKVQGDLTQALSKLMVVVEKYPDLKANENFLALQAQLEGTENRISFARKHFNDMIKEYNIYTRKFPYSIIAKMFDFKEKEYFKADVAAATAPKVEF